jgi:membrane-associated phospholipid phosphatase
MTASLEPAAPEQAQKTRKGDTTTSLLRIAAELLRAGYRLWFAHWQFWLAMLGVTVALLISLFSVDEMLLDWIGAHAPTVASQHLARALSFWGDFITGTVLICVAVWLIGTSLEWPRWRRAALAAFLAAALAGITAKIMGAVIGRPRPYLENADVFAGLALSTHYQSFPSGHTATSVATAAAISTAVPVLSPVALAGAGMVIWSRLILDRHYPSDILMGIFLAMTFGVPMGAAARKE